MKHFFNTTFVLFVIAVLAFSNCHVVDMNTVIYSPDGNIKLIFEMQNDTPFYAVRYKVDQVIEPSSLGLELSKPFEGGFRIVSSSSERTDGWWKPVYGEYSKIRDHFNSLEIELEEKEGTHRRINIVFKVYDEGVAFHYSVPDQDTSVWQINKELTTFNFAKSSFAYPIYRTEQTYSNMPVKINEVDSGAFLPLTIRLQNGFASLLEADVNNYPHTLLDKTPDGNLVTRIYGKAKIKAPFETPWRILLLAEDEGRLIENEFLILNLNPPCIIEDVSWIEPGKTISNENSGCGLQTEELKKLVDFASENGFRYLQLDWGWYGTEVKWSEEQIQSFREIMPDKLKNSGWEKNAQANPYTVANGYVPYGWTERWRNSYTKVDLDIHELVAYAKTRGVGISLYVEAGSTLQSHDLDSLFSQYEEWGLSGLKPGFVKYGTQDNTNWIQNMVETAAKHHLLLCIHDDKIPDGTSRTYPNLIINEGGGGQEGNHPVAHDVMLPFARCLAGPFDYTPHIYTRGRSNAHMLSFFIVYYGPAQTIRGGYAAWNDNGEHGQGGEELEFLRRVPATWDDTKVLQAKIGEHLITARRSGDLYFIGGMNGDMAFDGNLKLDFLDDGKNYTATIFKDDQNGFVDGFCSAKKEVLIVDSNSSLPIKMLPAGGFIGIFDPTN